MEKEPDKKYETMKKIIDALEDILCSYQGRGHLSVYTDLDSGCLARACPKILSTLEQTVFNSF